MAAITDVITGVRNKLRDFPRTFQCDIAGDGVVQICELPVVMVEPTTLSVQTINSGSGQILALNTPAQYTLDDHHGDIVLVAPLDPGLTLNVMGQHYTWFTDSDITNEAMWYIRGLNMSVNNPTFFDGLVATSGDPRIELAVRGTLVACLWALLVELSFDIDTRTPEGIDIPVSQRFAQVERLIQTWTARYDELAQQLNLGLGRIEMLTLRRVSRTTGRLVPIYQEQEYDDMATPVRMYPPIDHDQLMGDPPTATLPSGTDPFS